MPPRAGVDGLIVVDLPTEEADLLLPYSDANGLDFIRLVAPTTDDERLPHVLSGSSGFVYYVSITGITGTDQRDGRASGGRDPRVSARDRSADRHRLRRANARTSGHAARVADAAVVASALIDTLSANLDADGRQCRAAVERCWIRCGGWRPRRAAVMQSGTPRIAHHRALGQAAVLRRRQADRRLLCRISTPLGARAVRDHSPPAEASRLPIRLLRGSLRNRAVTLAADNQHHGACPHSRVGARTLQHNSLHTVT